MRLSEKSAKETQALVEQALYELKKIIVGQEHFLERLFVALIAHGHVLVEGPPGLAKTLTLKSLATVLSVDFKRIQFTPDLLPADLIGTRVYHPGEGRFSTELGPIFANFVLADEINRAPAKVQSALLEAMQERQVTIGRETFPLRSPFLVMATQNPIESEGTYILPEAQLDRFLFKLLVSYPSNLEELVIIQRVTDEAPVDLSPLIRQEEILTFQEQVGAVFMEPKLMNYIVAFIQATRTEEAFRKYILHGASPRGSLAVTISAKARALLHGRTYVLPEDISHVLPDCLRHRLILSYEGLAAGQTTDLIIQALQELLPLPAEA